MNLLHDDFISTTQGKVSLKAILTGVEDYQLQYYFDEIQLAMLQLLSALTTTVLQPTANELQSYIKNGLSSEQYDAALSKIPIEWFDSNLFMQSKAPVNAKFPVGPITKLLSGVECGSSPDAIGLFSEVEHAEKSCPDCIHALNYNLHMNIKGECFGPTGATGIRGGGTISTLIAGDTLKETLLNNTIAVDYFSQNTQLDRDAITAPMWIEPQTGAVYQAKKIGLIRGLFALAYHIEFSVDEKPCTCDICGHLSDKSVTTFNREKYTGHYGSTRSGREGGAGWWPHPYTPQTIKEDGVYATCVREQHWQSWSELSSYVVGKETNTGVVAPAYIVKQYQALESPRKTHLLVGGNIAKKGSILGRVYDLYSMPSSLNKQLSKVTQVIDAGLEQQALLSKAFNKMFGVGYDKRFVGGIKTNAMQQFSAKAQQVIQRNLLDVEQKEASVLRKLAVVELREETKRIFTAVQNKYQHDLPLFKALVKGGQVLSKQRSD